MALKPHDHDALNLMGRVAFEREKLEDSIDYYRRALKVKPDLADAYNNMGNALKELGQLDEARAAYVRAIELDPEATGAYVNLADSMKFKPGDPYLARIEALAIKTESLSQKDRIHLDYALGKAYTDLADHKRAFSHLVAGSTAKRNMISYDEADAMAFFDRIENVFTADLIAGKAGGGDSSRRPIFILGMPRSGTTLVEQIIASHPMVRGGGELHELNDAINGVKDTHGGAALPYPEYVPALDPSAMKRLGERYLASVRKRAPEGERVTDKMPSNYYFLGLIHLALPNAKIIHTMRDPVDTCVSCFSKLFSAEQNHTYDLGELGRYHRRYEQLMAHWRKVLPPGSFLDMQYEDVVADLECAARRIITYCDLPWDDRCLAFHETNRPVRTASATQVRQPIYKSAIDRWRLYEEFLGPLLIALGR
jgi:tetratricopeptide (TPR) repeat protein